MLPPREKGSSTHNPADPMCEVREDADYPGEDFGEICWVCHAQVGRRELASGMVRELGS